MSLENVIKFGAGNAKLSPSPIRAEWILEGNPVARNRILSSSRDGTASTLIWDCTAGRFNWYYDIDESVYIIEGSVIVKEPSGATRRLTAGETIFFPAGSRAEWEVEEYIRKIAFCRSPLPWPLVLAKRGFKFLKRLALGNRNRDTVPGTFKSN
jgi:uncharacterized protein